MLRVASKIADFAIFHDPGAVTTGRRLVVRLVQKGMCQNDDPPGIFQDLATLRVCLCGMNNFVFVCVCTWGRAFVCACECACVYEFVCDNVYIF